MHGMHYLQMNTIHSLETKPARSSGMKGTYIKVLNEVIFDELEEIKAQRNKKAWSETDQK